MEMEIFLLIIPAGLLVYVVVGCVKSDRKLSKMMKELDDSVEKLKIKE